MREWDNRQDAGGAEDGVKGHSKREREGEDEEEEEEGYPMDMHTQEASGEGSCK